MKKGPLSNKEKKYVTQNISKFVGEVGRLAETMGRSTSIIQKFVDTLEKKPDISPVGSLFARKSDHGVTVMTEAASMASDANKAQKSPQPPSRYKKCIHKIKE